MEWQGKEQEKQAPTEQKKDSDKNKTNFTNQTNRIDNVYQANSITIHYNNSSSVAANPARFFNPVHQSNRPFNADSSSPETSASIVKLKNKKTAEEKMSENVVDTSLELLSELRRLYFADTLMRLKVVTTSIMPKSWVYLLGCDQEPKEIKSTFKRLKNDLKILWGKDNLICPVFHLKSGNSTAQYISKMQHSETIIVLCTEALKQAYEDFASQAVTTVELSLVFTQLIQNKSRVIPFYLGDSECIPFFLKDLHAAPLNNEKDYQKGLFTIFKQLIKDASIKEAISNEQKKLKQAYKAGKTLPSHLQQNLLGTLQQKQATEQKTKTENTYQQVANILTKKPSLQASASPPPSDDLMGSLDFHISSKEPEIKIIQTKVNTSLDIEAYRKAIMQYFPEGSSLRTNLNNDFTRLSSNYFHIIKIVQNPSSLSVTSLPKLIQLGLKLVEKGYQTYLADRDQLRNSLEINEHLDESVIIIIESSIEEAFTTIQQTYVALASMYPLSQTDPTLFNKVEETQKPSATY